ncbi:MAG: methyltransferase domain-containing protein [Nanoarchaeota archaeon]
MKRFIYSLTNLIFSNSKIFNKFRNLVHNNFKDEKSIIKRYFNYNKLTLDFGCGAGQFAPLFTQKSYYGIDTDKKYINFCKNNYKGRFSIIKTSPPYDFKRDYFNQILVSAVIHHLDDKKFIEIFKELSRILNNKGELMIIDHFTKKNQKKLLCKILINLDRGKYFRNPQEVISLLGNYFKIKKTGYFKNGPYKDYILILSKK